jgi:hypothetical protein
VWSLQNPDWQNMPTGLRAQIGTWLVHGLSSDDHAQMVLSNSLRKAGARPEEWGMKKPGQQLLVGAGVADQSREAMAAKTRFLVGELHDANGEQFDFDTLNDRFIEAILDRNFASMPTVAKLDRGSAEATGGWWDEQVAATDKLRAELLGSHMWARNLAPQPQPVAAATATPQVAKDAATAPVATRKPEPVRGKPAATAHVATDDDQPDDEEITEMHQEAAEVREVEGITLYDDPETEAIDLTRESSALPDVSGEDDPLYDPGEDAKPEPANRAEAVAALADAFDDLLTDETLRDPQDRSGRTVIVNPGLVFDRYRFRSRPWVSGEFAAIAEGKGDLKDRYVLVLAEDLGIRKGKYRLSRAGDAG